MKQVKLSEEELALKLEQAAGWSREDGKWIAKSYRFAAFPDAIAFVQRIAPIAEEELNHHPFISIDYTIVRLRLTTWHAGGLTELDFEAARRFDEVV